MDKIMEMSLWKLGEYRAHYDFKGEKLKRVCFMQLQDGS